MTEKSVAQHLAVWTMWAMGQAPLCPLGHTTTARSELLVVVHALDCVPGGVVSDQRKETGTKNF
eukprot:2221236-Amphidinium_carterae.2